MYTNDYRRLTLHAVLATGLLVALAAGRADAGGFGFSWGGFGIGGGHGMHCGNGGFYGGGINFGGGTIRLHPGMSSSHHCPSNGGSSWQLGPPVQIRTRYYRSDPPRNSPPKNIPVPTPVVEPEPNEVKVSIPLQLSPMENRVYEASVRECGSYANELTVLIRLTLEKACGGLGKGQQSAAIHRCVDEVYTLLGAGAGWSKLEPCMRKLGDCGVTSLDRELLARFEYAVRLMMVRDAFLAVANSNPRGRSCSLPVSAVPTGQIAVVFDPTLAVGVALVVDERLVVCGSGGRGELMLVETSAAAALGLPVAEGEPVPDMVGEPDASSKGGIVIRNAATAATPVNYVINRRHRYKIDPGATQELPAGNSWRIEFDRGNGRGKKAYTLKNKGDYEFCLVNKCWDLRTVKYDITIDNRNGTEDFQYVVDNKVVTVPAGQTQKQESDEPIVVTFDRGNGPDEPARKNLNKSGVYKVAVDADTNYLELFPETPATKKEPEVTFTSAG